MTDDMEQFEGQLPWMWTGAAELGYLIDPAAANVPLEGLMLIREQYPERPDDPDDLTHVELLDFGIDAALLGLGVFPSGDGGFYVNYGNLSRELAEAREQMRGAARRIYAAARAAEAGDQTPPQIEPGQEDVWGAVDRVEALIDEHAVINQGMSMAELESDVDDEWSSRDWWELLGWKSYADWQAHHKQERP
jgi:hypothetical protein